jgi:N-formylglutamate amidohydrolase
MSFPVFLIRPSQAALRPIIVSVPHAGTDVPDEVAAQLRPDILQQLPDTDWLVAELYAFCQSLGIPMISACLSRYVVDLNRPMTGPALYSDQRCKRTRASSSPLLSALSCRSPGSHR